MEGTDPVIQILSKDFLMHGVQKIFIRCRNNPDIDWNAFYPTDAGNFSVLNRPKQRCLDIQRHISYFV